MTAAPYRLVPARLPPAAVPRLDPSQQAVVDHERGPLLVLAGPGTGKTTTLVEAVAARVQRGLRPEQVLVLTFSRKAADELRERIASRIGRTLSEPAAYTFHAFCSALVSAYGDGVPRLLSGPERLVRIRDLLAGDAAGEGSTTWPPALRDCLHTRGFAQEVADLLDRLRERALTADDLRSMARREGRDDWRAAADFFDEYTQVLRGRETDYAELVAEALRLLETDLTVLADVRDRYRAVFVDEYQDTDPAQERMLALLAGDGRDLVVVGDPDQSIYRFRGADVSCLLEFPARFPGGGRPAPVVSLAISRRAGRELLAASRSVARGLPAPGLSPDKLRVHRDLQAAPAAPGQVAVGLYGTEADEAVAIADLLRRAHLGRLEPGRRLPWSDMAVLVRSGLRSVPVLHRSLVAAGVPVVVASDELPVARDPAVAPLLLALRVADDVTALDPTTAMELLTSPLVGAGPAQLRRLGRALRAGDRAADAARRAADPGRLPVYPRPSPELIAEAVREPHRLAHLDDRVASGARRLVALLGSAAETLRLHRSAELALWELWDGSGWPRRLAAASQAGGQEGRAADRDLDAIGALFDAMARFEESRPHGGVRLLLAELEAQEIPPASRVEGVLGQGGVRLLTAHRAKGLEWDLVVVAGVQDGGWPDVRRRGSLLSADRLGRAGVEAPASPATLVVDERRLFYVAVTRARRHLFVTAVQSADDAGPRPSRFLEELGVDLPTPQAGPGELLSAPSLTGRLRRAAVDPGASDGLRAAAAGVLAQLGGSAGPAAVAQDHRPAVAAALPDHRPAVGAALPGAWWGLAEATSGTTPVRPRDQDVGLSASALAAFDRCPLRWFLEREVKAGAGSTAAQGFGSVLHALARLMSTDPAAEVEMLLDRVDTVWEALGLEAAWLGDQQRDKARAALGRLTSWLQANRRQHIGSEVSFGPVPAAGALLSGSVDRLDADAAGGLHVVDYKTAKNKPSAAEVTDDLQLGFYQLAGQAGAFDGVAGGSRVMGGAELVQLVDGLAGGRPSVQPQEALPPDGGAVADAVRRMVDGVVTETFPARPNSRCPKCPVRQACPAQEAGRQVVS